MTGDNITFVSIIDALDRLFLLTRELEEKTRLRMGATASYSLIVIGADENGPVLNFNAEWFHHAAATLRRYTLPEAAQAELDAFEVHIREHRGTEAAVEGCRFCFERNVRRLERGMPEKVRGVPTEAAPFAPGILQVEPSKHVEHPDGTATTTHHLLIPSDTSSCEDEGCPHYGTSHVHVAKGQKGDFDGECARTVCHAQNARWFNVSTRRYYCTHCASLINIGHAATSRVGEYMHGQVLCTISRYIPPEQARGTPTMVNDTREVGQ